MERITSLYPQYQRSQDRRQQNIPVAVERRSGKDRRSQDRVVMDKQLTRDIFEIKSQVEKLEKLAPKLFSDNITKSVPFGSSTNNQTQDQLFKESKPDLSEIARQEAQLQNKASMSFQAGIIAAALAGAIAISFMGSVGAVIAVGTSLYIGGKVLKTLIAKETSEEEKEKEI